MSGCPVHLPANEPSERKSSGPHDALFPALEVSRDAKGERYTVRSLALIRSVLRDPEATQQAGFGAEVAAQGASKMRPPVLYLEGAAHKAQRTATARFFTPQTVSRDYREMMERLSDELVGELKQKGSADLSGLSMRLAVQVAARVVGLTNSSLAGMSRRLDTFFEDDPTQFSWRPDRLWRFLVTQSAMWRFFYQDVKPAIRARRKRPQEDVISHLLDKGYNDFEILTECITYAAAGMVTTREFISMATWHFLENEPLKARYLVAGERERQAILHEILRLEPVVGHLYRRTRKPLTLTHEDETFQIPAGTLLDLDLRAANAEAETVGDAPLRVCPGRDLPKGVQDAVLSFGDGHHRCPGAYIAIQESDIFLTRLLRLPLEAERGPEMTWNDLTAGYDLRRFVVRTA
jgi:cytochrome P450